MRLLLVRCMRVRMQDPMRRAEFYASKTRQRCAGSQIQIELN